MICDGVGTSTAEESRYNTDLALGLVLSMVLGQL
jgi:hypothetical protein